MNGEVDLSTRLRNILAIIIALLLVGTAFGVQMMVDTPDLPPFDLLPTLLRGLSTTIMLTVFGSALALVMALFTGILRASPYRIVRWITSIYVEIFRGTSILVQLFWIFFVLPLPPFNVSLSALQAGILALGLNVGAYGAEVVRGAIQSISRGQIEASIALNMTPTMMMRRVILPQALVRIVPPFGNLLIELLKATSLVALITLADVTFQAQTLRQSVGVSRVTEIFGLLLVIYFLIAYPITLGVRWVENRRQWA
ncbi:MAG: ectoine/hydroxyectoine ABC transporter permease subunit EhuC [Candidatus Promineifilaceae bacterium]|nr:ectoine/hydroxyectoine ABC transporter permease subunit EhuC [Candidatus Promineifilaceae bacterium]